MVYVLECGHIFLLESLDQYMFTKPQGDEALGYKSCPVCRRPIFLAGRYQMVFKKKVLQIEKLKWKMEKERKKQREMEKKNRQLAIEGLSSAMIFAAFLLVSKSSFADEISSSCAGG